MKTRHLLAATFLVLAQTHLHAGEATIAVAANFTGPMELIMPGVVSSPTVTNFNHPRKTP